MIDRILEALALTSMLIALLASLAYGVDFLVKRSRLRRKIGTVNSSRREGMALKSLELSILNSSYFLLLFFYLYISSSDFSSLIKVENKLGIFIWIVYAALILGFIVYLIEIHNSRTFSIVSDLRSGLISGLLLLTVSSSLAYYYSYLFLFFLIFFIIRDFLLISRAPVISENTYSLFISSGTSMEPAIVDGDKLLIIVNPTELFPTTGDIVIYSRLNINSLKNEYISHRVANSSPLFLTTRGDNADYTEKIPVRRVIGLVVSIKRNGEIVYINHRFNTPENVVEAFRIDELSAFPKLKSS